MTAVTREGWILTAFVGLGLAAVVVAVSAWILLWRDHRFRKRSREGGQG